VPECYIGFGNKSLLTQPLAVRLAKISRQEATTSMKLKTLQDLFIHELKDLYSAETQLVKALPKMAKAATHQDLKDAFQEHLDQTKTHVSRLEQIAEACEAC